MGDIFGGIDDDLAGWIAVQPLFFVGTAPSGDTVDDERRARLDSSGRKL